MKSLALYLVLFAGQAIALKDKPVVHLKPHSDLIQPAFRGALVELIQAPAIVRLPTVPPKPDDNGDDWTVDVRNFGPAPVTIVGNGGFSAPLAVNQTVHIYAHGSIYILKH
jgi:hypothetical protein